MSSTAHAEVKQKTISELVRAKGIGPKLAERIWDQFGQESIQKLIDDPLSAAAAVSGLSELRAKDAQAFFQMNSPNLNHAEPDDAAPSPPSPEIDNEPNTTPQILKEFAELPDLIVQDWTRLFRQRQTVERVLQKYKDMLLQYPMVTGIHTGLRRKNDKVILPPEYCIRVHVSKKADPDGGDVPKLLPEFIEGIRINVLEKSYTTANGPILGGLAIAAQATPGNKGTLGGIIYSGLSSRYVTNHHVAGNAPNLVIQPPEDNTGVIGTVVDQERSDVLDCSIIQPQGSRTRLRQIIGLSPASDFHFGKLTSVDATIGTRAFKVGAKNPSPTLVGKVTEISGIAKVTDLSSGVTRDMRNQIFVDTTTDQVIMEQGDSGALLLVQAPGNNQYYVVGLVHALANDGKSIVASHFEDVVNRFGVSVRPVIQH